MRFLFLLCVLFTLGEVLPLCAEEPTALTLDPAFCRRLTKHAPAPDVAYKPGVDVYGKKVAPADINGHGSIELPRELSIPLTADLFKFLSLDQSNFPFNALQRNDINLGTLTLRDDKVFYNGQPLTDAQQDELVVLCSKK